MATLQRVLLSLALQVSPALITRLRFARVWGCCAIHRLRPLRPCARRLQHALQEQEQLLGELQLLRQAHNANRFAQLAGGYDPDTIDQLITTAEELEASHGWDPLLVDGWLERLGLWDQEI